jgi:predicted lactoylglutathione lyase
MPKMIFVNLPVADLGKAETFYQSIGCTRDPRFSNEQAAMMIWSDSITFMLLSHGFFQGFTPKRIADAHATSEVLLCLSCDSREEVDALVEKAIAGGGKADIRDRQDMPFMYGRTFEDPDGHIFEPMWMDVEATLNAMSGAHEAAAA